MAIEVLKDVTVSLGGTVITGTVEVALDDGSEEVDRTVFSSQARKTGSGLPNPSCTIKAFHDFGASPAAYVIAKALLNTDTAIIIRKDSTANLSATNPSYEVTMHLARIHRMSAVVGSDPMFTMEFKSAGTAVSEVTAS